MKSLNVYSGNSALIDYLNPDSGPYAPLVELPEDINPYYQYKVRIFAKLMNTLPLLNIKSLPAFNMLSQAKKMGELDHIEALIENSSGNTVYSLSMIGRLMGVDKTIAIVSNEVSRGKLNLLRLFGINIRVNKEPICPDPSDQSSGIHKAKRWADNNDWFNPGQYDNPDNPDAHKKWTGKQIWEQTEGKLSIFCTGLGTTGTMYGTGSFLKKKNSRIQTVGVVRKPNNPVPGPRTRSLLSQIAFNWKDIVDRVEEVGTVDAYGTSLSLIRRGLLVGPSSGFNLKGLFSFLDKLVLNKKIERLKKNSDEINAVFIACDTPFPYVDDYFTYLKQSQFPEVEKKELLNTPLDTKNTYEKNFDFLQYDMAVNTAFYLMFAASPESIWNQIEKNTDIAVNPMTITVDLRGQDKFLESHIPYALNIPFDQFNENYANYRDQWRNQTVLLFCNHGDLSNIAAQMLRKEGIEAFSIKGGQVEWSQKNLPRWKPEMCRVHRSVADRD